MENANPILKPLPRLEAIYTTEVTLVSDFPHEFPSLLRKIFETTFSENIVPDVQ
jgi:hypothetical protein